MTFRFTKFDPHLTNLLSRLDYEGFYSKYLWNQPRGMGNNFQGGMTNFG